VKVEEPDEETACAMLRGMAPLVAAHFNVRIHDEAITEAVHPRPRRLPCPTRGAEGGAGRDAARAAAGGRQRRRRHRRRLDDPDKPQGVFLFVGPSGVGKTETALALADVLYGGERKLVTTNMSAYQEAHSVSGPKGSPPGYVGYGEGGVQTEAVRRNPYNVVLPDAEGREVDLRNTIIILTSNAASGALMQACLNRTPEERTAAEALQARSHRAARGGQPQGCVRVRRIAGGCRAGPHGGRGGHRAHRGAGRCARRFRVRDRVGPGHATER
jgi:ATP-dependent Clp protease ATP-binding subunit ClpA